MTMKKVFLSLMAVTMMASALTFSSCTPEKKVEPKPQPTKSTEISGTIANGKTKSLKASETYILGGSLIVEKGGVLNIEAGTTIKAKKGFGNYILVLPGGKIYAKGTASKPITITADIENAKSGYWGGLIINGNARISGENGVIAKGSTEINTAYEYGGTDNNDSSGELTYVKLLYTGARSSESIEHNGLTLNAVGAGTKIENLYIAHSADDAVEFFGGSVNVTGLLAVNPDDDMFDFTQGYTGTLKNCYGVWEKGYLSTEEDPRGIEADGNLDGKTPSDINQSNFNVENMTIDLRLAASTGQKDYMHDVIKIRRGAKATVKNALVKGTGTAKDLIDLTDKKGNANAGTVVSLTNQLSTPITGKVVNGENPNAKVNAGNTGCNTNLFQWTGYGL